MPPKKAKITSSPNGSIQSPFTNFVKSTITSPNHSHAKRKINIDNATDDNTQYDDGVDEKKIDWASLDPTDVDVSMIPDPEDWVTPQRTTHTSPVWKYVMKSASISYLVKCKCGRRIKTVNASTTNISNHLKTHHNFDCRKL